VDQGFGQQNITYIPLRKGLSLLVARLWICSSPACTQLETFQQP